MIYDIMNNGIMFGEELCGFYQEIYIILWGKKKKSSLAVTHHSLLISMAHPDLKPSALLYGCVFKRILQRSIVTGRFCTLYPNCCQHIN